MIEEHGASSVDRWALCPASRRMERGLPDDSNDLSAKGTLLHLYMADPTLIPVTLDGHDRELLAINRRLVDLVFAETVKLFGISADEPFFECNEVKMFLHRGIKVLYPGTCDRRRYYRRLKLMVIVDYKFGFKIVTAAAANKQLRSYACMGDELNDCENVVVAITQPRLPFEQRVTMASYSRADLAAARLELYSIVDETNNPDAAFHASESCQYCKAKMPCEAYKAKMLPVLRGDVVDRLSTLTPEKRAEVIQAIKFAENIKDSVIDYERGVIANGGESLYAVGKDSQTPSIADTGRALELLRAAKIEGLTETDLIDCLKLTLGKLEEKLGGLGMKPKEAKAMSREVLGDTISYTPKRGALTRVVEKAALTN